MSKYMDKSLGPEVRAKALLEGMSLEEKMGQVVCYFPRELSKYEELEKEYPHGVGQVTSLEMRNLKSLEEAVQFQREIQEKVMELSEHRIPAIFHMEGLSGAYLQGATSFPSGIGRGSTWNPELEKKVGKIVGRQERAVGITNTFAPVLDLTRDPRMGRIGESYSEDPTLASAMGVGLISGLQSEQTGPLSTEAVAKHFLGSHDTRGGIHGTDCEITDRQLREIHAKPFQAGITEAGLMGVMPCYCSINGEPVSASKKMLTDLLREEMGFEGITVSDYCAVMNIHSAQRVCESFTQAGLRAMDAGMDMELQFKKCFNEELGEWFATGKADIKILDQAVLRVLTTKFRMGLFENPFALSGEELKESFHDSQDEEVSLKTALESMILLKNDGVLPISKDTKKIAVIGCHATTARFMFSGYTHFSMAEGTLAAIETMAGLETAKGEKNYEMITIPGTPIQEDNPKFEAVLKHQKPGIKSLIEELEETMPQIEFLYSYGYNFAGNDLSHHEEALKVAKEADLVILTLGGKYSTGSIASTGEGCDSTHINLPECQETFIEKISKINKPLVGVHFDGRPISSDAADKYLNGIIEAWNPGEKGSEGIACVLFGDYNPGGKLPVTVAYSSGQIPIFYNHVNNSSYHQGGSIAFADYVDMPHTPRYFFGHGLSYTTFEYSNISLNKREINPDEKIEISLEIKNTGTMKGDEVVQLYLRDRYASLIRPVMELAGFKRISLEAGEKKKIVFHVKASQMAFVDRDMKWKIEGGDFDVKIGSSSEDIRLEETFKVTSDLHIDGKTRGFYAEVEVY